MSSESTIIRRWFDFEQMRKECLDLLKDVELSNFAIHYGARTEAEFRDKLKKLGTLLSKMEETIGPPEPPPTNVS
jgi:hypothetical protein